MKIRAIASILLQISSGIRFFFYFRLILFNLSFIVVCYALSYRQILLSIFDWWRKFRHSTTPNMTKSNWGWKFQFGAITLNWVVKKRVGWTYYCFYEYLSYSDIQSTSVIIQVIGPVNALWLCVKKKNIRPHYRRFEA